MVPKLTNIFLMDRLNEIELLRMLKLETLSGANLSGINLYRSNFQGVNLVGTNLSRTYLQGANLCSSNLSRANLSGADISGAKLRSAKLRGANLCSSNLSRANLSGADISGANLYDANLFEANLHGAKLSGADLRSANLAGADLLGASLAGADLAGASLAGANLTGANLHSTNLRRANLLGVLGISSMEEEMEMIVLLREAIRKKSFLFYMSYSHEEDGEEIPDTSSFANFLNTCGTTHCAGGFCQVELAKRGNPLALTSAAIAGSYAIPSTAQFFASSDSEFTVYLDKILSGSESLLNR